MFNMFLLDGKKGILIEIFYEVFFIFMNLQFICLRILNANFKKYDDFSEEALFWNLDSFLRTDMLEKDILSLALHAKVSSYLRARSFLWCSKIELLLNKW